jgi:hypothetical protein
MKKHLVKVKHSKSYDCGHEYCTGHNDQIAYCTSCSFETKIYDRKESRLVEIEHNLDRLLDPPKVRKGPSPYNASVVRIKRGK